MQILLEVLVLDPAIPMSVRPSFYLPIGVQDDGCALPNKMEVEMCEPRGWKCNKVTRFEWDD